MNTNESLSNPTSESDSSAPPVEGEPVEGGPVEILYKNHKNALVHARFGSRAEVPELLQQYIIDRPDNAPETE